jgi:hypothetical protein
MGGLGQKFRGRYLKNHRTSYLRYLWLNLNKTKTGINHFFLQTLVNSQFLTRRTCIKFFFPLVLKVMTSRLSQ